MTKKVIQLYPITQTPSNGYQEPTEAELVTDDLLRVLSFILGEESYKARHTVDYFADKKGQICLAYTGFQLLSYNSVILEFEWHTTRSRQDSSAEKQSIRQLSLQVIILNNSLYLYLPQGSSGSSSRKNKQKTVQLCSTVTITRPSSSNVDLYSEPRIRLFREVAKIIENQLSNSTLPYSQMPKATKNFVSQIIHSNANDFYEWSPDYPVVRSVQIQPSFWFRLWRKRNIFTEGFDSYEIVDQLMTLLFIPSKNEIQQRGFVDKELIQSAKKLITQYPADSNQLIIVSMINSENTMMALTNNGLEVEVRLLSDSSPT